MTGNKKLLETHGPRAGTIKIIFITKHIYVPNQLIRNGDNFELKIFYYINEIFLTEKAKKYRSG